jgi:hypothetical protein
MALTKNEKCLMRINMIKHEIIAHLEMDRDVTWNLSNQELSKVIDSIQSYFETDMPGLCYRIFFIDEEN